jgi:hypothetical protein
LRFLAQEDKPDAENVDAGASRAAASSAGAAVGAETAAATLLGESIEVAGRIGSALVTGGVAAESWLSELAGGRSDGLTCCSSMIV